MTSLPYVTPRAARTNEGKEGRERLGSAGKSNRFISVIPGLLVGKWNDSYWKVMLAGAALGLDSRLAGGRFNSGSD